MIIGLTGETDNRLILYGLIKLLNAKGDVAVISPNRHLKRLLPETGDDEGFFQNTYTVITELSPDEVWQEVEQNPEDFNHVIYDLGLNVADNVDSYIHIYDYSINDKEEEFLNMVESFANVRKVQISYDGKREKSSSNVRATIQDFAAINKTEHMREFVAYNNKTLSSVLGTIVGDDLMLSKSAISNVLKKARGNKK